MDMKIEIERNEDYAIIHLAGAFHSGDYDFPSQLKLGIQSLVTEDVKKVLIDFEYVTFFGSDGIGSITNGHYNVCNAGGRLVPYALPPYILSSFKIVGLDKVFPLFQTKEEALIYLEHKVK